MVAGFFVSAGRLREQGLTLGPHCSEANPSKVEAASAIAPASESSHGG